MNAVETASQTLGSILREARASRQWSLEKLSECTKIKISNLEWMEEDRFDRIAAPTYARGFLKIVAHTLELNETELIKMYEERYPQKSKQVIFFAENQAARKPRTWPWKKSVWGATAAAAGLAVLAGISIWNRTAIEPAPKVEPAPTQTQASLVREVQLLATVGATMQPVLAPPLSFTVRAQNDVWVKVLSDGKLIFENTLRKDEEERWQAQEKFQVRIGRPADIQILINGKPFDLRKEKKPVNLWVTRDEVKIDD